jgi:hypothetical protein
VGTKKGFNVPIRVQVISGCDQPNCVDLNCQEPFCADAHLVPNDDKKTHDSVKTLHTSSHFINGCGILHLIGAAGGTPIWQAWHSGHRQLAKLGNLF